MRRNCDFKKVDITLSHQCFPESCFDIQKQPPEVFYKKRCSGRLLLDIVTTTFLKLKQKNLHGRTFTE